MKIFFTADCHFSHPNIIKYCNRPFKNIHHMNEEMIARWNNVVEEDDLVYHVGDFCFKGVNNAKEFENRLNGSIVHFEGNHDRNNGVKTYLQKAMLYFGGKDVYCQHHPPNNKDDIPACDLVICGHVHEKWKHKFVEGCEIPIINVGVDVWNYEPLSTLSLLKFYGKIKKRCSMKP